MLNLQPEWHIYRPGANLAIYQLNSQILDSLDKRSA
jgi:hypothetical protein